MHKFVSHCVLNPCPVAKRLHKFVNLTQNALFWHTCGHALNGYPFRYLPKDAANHANAILYPIVHKFVSHCVLNPCPVAQMAHATNGPNGTWPKWSKVPPEGRYPICAPIWPNGTHMCPKSMSGCAKIRSQLGTQIQDAM